jgi:N-acetylated-alpha-linked acidic dipeptidase
MHGFLSKAAVVLTLSASLLAQTPVKAPDSIMGFSPAASAAQAALEARFDANLRAENLAAWNKRLSARPHHIGSAYNKENADFIASQFRSWGYDTAIERFDVLFPTPKTRLVQVTAPEKFTLKLSEPAVAGDATSGQQAEQLPSYNAYSIDGDVTAPVVYVNYGIPAARGAG